MTTTMEPVVIQLQRELLTLKAQVASRAQVAAAVQARRECGSHAEYVV